MKGKKILAVLLMLVMVFTMAACGNESGSEGGQETYNLKISLEPSESNFMAENWREWAEAVTEASDGRIEFTFYYDNTLVDANAQYQQLVSGVADIADVHRYESDGFVINERWKLLTSGIKPEQQTELSYRLLEEFPAVADEFSDVKILAHAYSGGGAYDFLTVDKAVESPEDLEGMTIWCEADWNGFIEACGATPVNTPFSEVYSSLQKNMYDGLFIAAETLESCNFAEVCKYVTMVDICYMSGPGHLMNLDVYNSMPDDLKAILDDPQYAAIVEDGNREDGFALEESSIQWAKDTYGVTQIELTDDQKQAFLDLLNQAKQGLGEQLDSQGLPGTEMIEAIAQWAAE